MFQVSFSHPLTKSSFSSHIWTSLTLFFSKLYQFLSKLIFQLFTSLRPFPIQIIYLFGYFHLFFPWQIITSFHTLFTHFTVHLFKKCIFFLVFQTSFQIISLETKRTYWIFLSKFSKMIIFIFTYIISNLSNFVPCLFTFANTVFCLVYFILAISKYIMTQDFKIVKKYYEKVTWNYNII